MAPSNDNRMKMEVVENSDGDVLDYIEALGRLLPQVEPDQNQGSLDQVVELPSDSPPNLDHVQNRSSLRKQARHEASVRRRRALEIANSNDDGVNFINDLNQSEHQLPSRS